MELNCEEVRLQVAWLLDGEIEADQIEVLQEHIKFCRDCRAVVERQTELRDVVRRAGARVHAPAGLRDRVRDMVQRDVRPHRGLSRWVPAAAAAAIMLSFVWQGGVGEAQDLEQFTSRHASNLPMDVRAKDWGQVQDYLTRRLPFAVPRPTLGSEQLNLVGGRVTQVGNREAAYIRYRTGQGQMSVFVHEDRGMGVNELAPMYQLGKRRIMMHKLRGFTVARWRANGLVYSVVSDLPEQHFETILYLTP